jgi:hypothetical protein
MKKTLMIMLIQTRRQRYLTIFSPPFGKKSGIRYVSSDSIPLFDWYFALASDEIPESGIIMCLYIVMGGVWHGTVSCQF